MIASPTFERSVFVNCPFDDAYRPILEAILFCIVDCDLTPRLATERLDSGEVRLEKIVELIKGSRYSVHDLSRIRSKVGGELARLNMPFELGVDYGVSRTAEGVSKHLLVVVERKYDYQAALSDIAGWDVADHGGDYESAIHRVRDWLQHHGEVRRSRSQVVGDYTGFQEWDYERLLAEGWSESDVQDRGTAELLEAMLVWREADRPATYT